MEHLVGRSMQYHAILREYVRDYALPAMLAHGRAFKAAKAIDWPGNQRQEYHIDQPLRTHILNGLYGLTRVLEYLASNGYYSLNESLFRRVLVLFTLHDVYKDRDIAATRLPGGEFGVPLAELDRILEETRLREFAPVRAEDVRAALISIRSRKVGDFSSASPGTPHLLTLVHLADDLASQQSARDLAIAERRLQSLLVTGKEDVVARTRQRMSKRTGVSIPPLAPKPSLSFWYHELDDYRGLSTLLLHKSAERVLADIGLYPVLYFANGILYLGPDPGPVDAADVRERICSAFFEELKREGQKEPATLAAKALDRRKGTVVIKTYAYLFLGAADLLGAVTDLPLPKRAAGFVGRLVARRVEKRKCANPSSFYTRYALPPGADAVEYQAQRWLAASRVVMAAANIAEALVPCDALDWLFTTFGTPPVVASAIREQKAVLSSGGNADHCIIVAYHWLVGYGFGFGNRAWNELETTQVQQAALACALAALKAHDTDERRRASVERQLGFADDCQSYVRTHLVLSFAPQRLPLTSPLREYEQERTSHHKRLCSLCNRLITPAALKKKSEIQTLLAEQQAHVFSNRQTPSMVVNHSMVWCPMCHLEFLLRSLNGQGYPSGTDYNASYRLSLYILPDYSFTPQLWNDAGEALLGEFYKQETVVTRLQLRGDEDNPGIASRWLRERVVDPEWLEQAREMFAAQAADMAATPHGKPRQRYGDRLTFSFKNPNYLLMTYSNAVPAGLSPAEQARVAPTHIEVWAKGLYAATIIHLLTGTRIYLTDRPYLTINRPEQMKTILAAEGLHTLLYSVLPIPCPGPGAQDSDEPISSTDTRLPLSALPAAVDLLSAIWEITVSLFSCRPGERRNVDKQVAQVLEELNHSLFAGATLYKRLMRQGKDPDGVCTAACQIMLPATPRHGAVRGTLADAGYQLMLDREGGELMDLVEQLADLSLRLYLPLRTHVGRAHRYEALVRVGIEAIKNRPDLEAMEDGELTAFVGGRILKRLAAIRGGCFPATGAARLETAQALAELLVAQLFRGRYKRSVATLTRQEDDLAAAVFFVTSQQIDVRWIEYLQEKKRREAKTNAAAQGSTSPAT